MRRYLLAWRRFRRRKRTRVSDDQLFAWRVQDILVGCGLGRTDRVRDGFICQVPHVLAVCQVPHVLAVDARPTVWLKIRILPGQTPDHYAAHAPTIAYNLGMAEVKVIPFDYGTHAPTIAYDLGMAGVQHFPFDEPYLIWLELLPKPDRAWRQ